MLPRTALTECYQGEFIKSQRHPRFRVVFDTKIYIHLDELNQSFFTQNDFAKCFGKV